jgi:hypothetical protein
MIYIEYISRRLEIEPHDFHEVMTRGFDKWGNQHGDDRMLLGAARTWRLGPNPEYFVVWDSPGHGFNRLDDWEQVFRSGDAKESQTQYRRVGRIEAAGCYESLLEPVIARNGIYYTEYFHPTRELSRIREAFKQRVHHHESLTLNLLVHRIGRLGPDPGGVAIWTLPNMAALQEIARDLDGISDPIQLVSAGTYQDIGKQIL